MKNSISKLLLVAIASGIFFACSKKEEEQSKPATPTKVSVQEITTNNSEVVLRYSGDIEAENSVQIGFAVPGTVASVLVNEGQRVKAGQLVASIDPTEYENALLIADAGLEQAQDMFTRLEELYNKGSLPAKDFIDIKSKLAQAKANKNLSLKRVKDTKLYAPLSGIITSKMIEKGATAAPGVPAFTIINTAKVYARITVPESEIGKLSLGQRASVKIATIDQQLSGKIVIINPLADPVTKSYNVKIELLNATGRLLPGMITDTEIATGQNTDVITIPSKAVIRDADDITYVFVASKENKAVRKRISASGFQGDNIVIKDGLSTGDKVVVAGMTKLKDGSAVSL